jgi:poly-gamma-glutamate synthesis protein (capsule biosynthesis protein)
MALFHGSPPELRKKKGLHGSLRLRCLEFLFLTVFFFLFPDFFTGETFVGTLPSPKEFERPAEEVKAKRSRFSFAAAGDALIHQGVYNAARGKKGGFDFRPMFRLVEDRIRAHDLAFYNQETILGGSALGLSTYPRFNSPQEVGDAMVDAGFNLVSLANNHTLDRGEKAVLASLEYWAGQEGVLTAGSYASPEDRDIPRLVNVNGISCAFLAYTTSTNGLKAPKGKDYYVTVYDREKVKEDVERARKEGKADVVLVSMHWGSEYVFTPGAEQKVIAEFLASLGVDIVVGHHPHVVQPVQMVEKTLVIYSLGNFISAQKELHKLIGLLVSLDVVKTELGGKSSISFENVTGTLLYNPRRSPLGRYVVVPFDLMKEEILKDFGKIHAKYAAYVKVDGTLSIRPPAKSPPKDSPKKKK